MVSRSIPTFGKNKNESAFGCFFHMIDNLIFKAGEYIILRFVKYASFAEVSW